MKAIVNTQFAERPLASQVVCKITGYTLEVCRDRKSLNTAFRLRYQAYLKVNAIPENEEELLYDDYDFQPNAFVHLIWYEGKPVATVRNCIFSDQYGWEPTECVKYFSGDIHKRLGDSTRLLECNRFAVDPDFQKRHFFFAKLLTLRAHGLNARLHGCTHIVAAVRANHIPFYQRFLGMKQASERGMYVAWADATVVLLTGEAETFEARAVRYGMPELTAQDEAHYAACAGINVSPLCIAA